VQAWIHAFARDIDCYIATGQQADRKIQSGVFYREKVMGKKDLYRLKDRSTIFTDPDSDFVISGDQQKPLPKKVGSVLAARVRTGALIKADEPPKREESKPAWDDIPRLPAAGNAGGSRTAPTKSEEKPAGKSGKKPGKNK